MTLRVLHVTPVWLPLTQNWIYTQVTCLPPGRVDCDVLCEELENPGEFPVPRLHHMPVSRPIRMLRAATLRIPGLHWREGALARKARALGSDILHSHFGDAAWRHIGAARAAGAAHVVSFYGFDASLLPRQPGWGARLKELFQAADPFICEGPHMARSLAALGCPESKLRVRHLGIALERFEYRPRQWRPGEPLAVLIAASFTEKKGIPFGIRALGRLRNIDLRVTIVGDARRVAEQQAQKREILHAIRESGLGTQVKLTGYLPHAEMTKQAYRHHVFLAPSITARSGDTEGGAPVSLAEMAATGMLVVSSRHCDIPEVVVDGETGFLAAERDVEGIAACLEKAAQAYARWPDLLAASRLRIETEFNATIQGSRLVQLYEEAAGSKREGR